MESNNILAKVSLGINALLIVAVTVLFVRNPGEGISESADVDSTLVTDLGGNEEMAIAYYNSDSLSGRSDFVKDIQGEMEASNLRGQEKMGAKEREIQKWQQDWESKGQLLPREQEKYMAEAQTKQQEIGVFEQNLNMEVAMEQEQLMITLYKRLQNYAESFCEKNEIDMLISFQMGQNVIHINPQFEVTDQFLNHVNLEYNSTFEAEDEEEEVEEK